ncbi:MAG: SUMF1/EgtB/PvdO family nonheme iron enzyme [Oscillatoria sp. SIO1A7]|nr:SUMF1/EgtB/PvdO family nonheme iron enzyme [Oscillatoria sp. SIO1A7]
MTDSQLWQPVVWQPQQLLADGRYIITGILGDGGFGSTYKATDKKTGKTVAVKTLNWRQQGYKTVAEFNELQIDFVNEALRLARCNHPHIVPVYEIVEHLGLMGMVMEYIEGDDLGKLVKDSGPMSFDEALQIIDQVGSALTWVHQNQLMHRDIKPQNILLRRPNSKDGGKAVLIDFGLARSFLLGITDSITNLGTLSYAPIEQCSRQGKFGPYLDVYGLAATMYYLRTGQEPIPAKFRKDMNLPLVEPKQHNSQMPDWENDAILQGLQLEPANRPQTVAAWLALLGIDNTATTAPTANNFSWENTNYFPSQTLLVIGEKTPNADNLNSEKVNSLATFEFTVVRVNDRGREIDRQRRSAHFFAEDLGNGVILEMVSIPGGSFMMGSPDGEEGRYNRESPQHRVTVPAFFMGKYPVTQAQWQAVMGNNPSSFKGENLPVENVSWYDAEEFCKKLAEKTGKSYRLPSEAEWEYACRAGTTTPFHFGQTITTDLANYRGTDWEVSGAYKGSYGKGPKGKDRHKTTPVCSFKVANAFGLCDMHGNVWEWCQDTWHENYQGAPTDGSAWIASNSKHNDRMLRGGSWFNSPVNCRGAFRGPDNANLRWRYHSFRVAFSSARTF